MSLKDPRFRKSQRPLLYREVVAKLHERPRTAMELLGDLTVTVEWEVAPSISVLEQYLRRWREAGALYDTPGGAKAPRIWRARRGAMSKLIIQRALGELSGGLLPDETTGEVINNAKPKLELATVNDEPEEHHEAELLPMDHIGQLARDLPEELWTATMTKHGVLISFDQYHRVLGLLTAITSAHEVA